MQAAQAYFACEKNEMLAANFLFENAESLRAEMEEEAPAAHGGAPGAGHGRPAAPPAAPSFPAPGAPGAAPAHPPAAEAKKEEKKEPESKEEGIFWEALKETCTEQNKNRLKSEVGAQARRKEEGIRIMILME